MNSQDYRNLQEAYLNVYEQEESLDEGIGSAIKGLFAKKKKPEAPKPESRGAELRQKYGTETSPKRQILDRTRERAEKDEKEYGDSPYSKSVAIKSRKTHDDYLKGGYSKYGAGEGSGGEGGSGGRGGGNAARRRAAALNKEQVDLFDYMMEYLIDEGYADTNENALVIMANMSEEWKESILLDERIRDSPRPDKEEYIKRRKIMDANAKQAKKEASTNNLIRSRKPAEPPTPGRVGNPSAATPSGEGLAKMLNPENKPPRPRVVTPYVPPEGEGTLAARTSKISPFGTVKPPHVPPAKPVRR